MGGEENPLNASCPHVPILMQAAAGIAQAVKSSPLQQPQFERGEIAAFQVVAVNVVAALYKHGF